MSATWALVPLKQRALAKSRLAAVLDASERAELAWHMADDVLRALAAARGLAGIAVLSADPGFAALARAHGARLLAEQPGLDWCTSLRQAALALAGDGATTLLVLPADLPTLRAADVEQLLAAHRGGLTLCPARRHGGTNALLVSPPDGIEFRYGAGSAERHLASARERGLAALRLELPAFAHDIDTPEDLRWLCHAETDCAARRWLASSGTRARLLAEPAAAGA